MQREHGDADALDDGDGLRLNVSGMNEQVWRHRRDTDLYTLLTQSEVVVQRAQVDHVWECQLINDANDAAIGEGAADALAREGHLGVNGKKVGSGQEWNRTAGGQGLHLPC